MKKTTNLQATVGKMYLHLLLINNNFRTQTGQKFLAYKEFFYLFRFRFETKPLQFLCSSSGHQWRCNEKPRLLLQSSSSNLYHSSSIIFKFNPDISP